MAVSFYSGFTKSGKSFHVQNKILPQWDRIVVYDDARCFPGDIFENPSKEELKSIFKKYAFKKNYRIIIRPSRTSIKEKLCDSAIKLAVALGLHLKNCVDPTEKNIQLVIDEADFVCTPHYQSHDLKYVINQGRHDKVDSHFIARSPNRVHTDIRANASHIVTFRLSNASEIPFFISNFSKKNCQLIQKLPKYWRFEWDETGEISVFNELNEKFSTPDQVSDEENPIMTFKLKKNSKGGSSGTGKSKKFQKI